MSLKLRPLSCSLLAAAILVMVSTPHHGLTAGWRLAKPKNEKAAKLEVSGKERLYWALSTKTTVTVKVKGPGSLKVITRPVVMGKEVVYSYQVLRDDQKRYHIARTARPGKNVKNPSRAGEVIGSDRSATFKIPEGEHTFAFSLPEGSSEDVYARFLVRGKNQLPANTDYIAFLPQKYGDEVRIFVKEQEYIYHRCDANHPIDLERIGPTTIKVVSRLEFDPAMSGGRRPYRLQVLQGDKIIQTRAFKASLSGAASYVASSRNVIGRGDTFQIDVPAGRQRFRITTPDSDTSVLLRFYLPQRDLGNTETTGATPRAGVIGRIIKNFSG